MKTIDFFSLLHRRAEQIGIRFEKDERLNQVIQNVKGIKWSHTHRCWYIKCSKEGFDAAYNSLKAFANIDTSALKEFVRSVDKIVVDPQSDKAYKPGTSSKVVVLNDENQAALSKFVQQLKLKAYSYATIKTYRNEFLQLLKLLKHKPVNELTTDDLRRYMVYAMEKEGIKENTAHSRINALKFYFEQVLGREKFFWEIPRPKRPLLLPKVLGEEELSRLFKALRNKKHKAVLFTAYSAGLRVSEVANLKYPTLTAIECKSGLKRQKVKRTDTSI